MLEALMVGLVRVERGGEPVGEMTTLSSRSHYGQPVWEGEEVAVGDELLITDTNGGDPWHATVVAVDPQDGWALVHTEECDGPYYALHTINGWVTTVEGEWGEIDEHNHDRLDAEVASIVAALNAGKLTLSGTIRLGDGWGCV